tara:strand:+ start:3737 stop:3904 length:168 start_codon:yes stop_codon:yes gene_type:complete
MKNGDHVRFKTYDGQEYWQEGLLLRYDSFMNIGEIITLGGIIAYAPERLIEVLNP